MKGLTKNISKVAIASLLCASGAIAAEAEVISSKVNSPQNVKKNQDFKSAAQPVPVAKQPVAKQVVDSSVNQAQYLKVKPQTSYIPPNVMAQTDSTDSLRRDLKIEPLSANSSAARTYPPGLSFGIPSAFGASWGDAYIAASGATAGKSRDGQIDGSITTGFGIGSSDTLGLEVSYNIGSIKNFGANGTFDLKAHRTVYTQGANNVAVAAGWNTFAQYGNEGVAPSSVYGAVTSYSLLQPDDSFNKMPLLLTFGVGGGGFRQGDASTGVFGGVGLQVHPQVGVGAAWSGVGINAGVSYVPIPTIPLTVGLTGGDLTNNSRGGTVLILNVSYGFVFLPR